ncbi:MAG: hypothetical protein LRS47_01350 [Desulfurococcales archaeon]|nr:hypothetical protein [Desulfurococcales archaeon]
MPSRPYLVKLGGSIITRKELEYTVDRESLCLIGRILSQAQYLPSVIIHGGGSFGHPIVHHLVSIKGSLSPRDLPLITHKMDVLNREVIRCLLEYQLPVVSFPPHALCNRDYRGELLYCNMEVVWKAVNEGLIPILYGDAILGSSSGVYIVSGDELMVYISRKYRIPLLYFLTDVDGVYEDMRSKRVVKRISISDVSVIDIKGSENIDVTGGMRAKLDFIKKLAPGSRVYILNGRREDHLEEAFLKDGNPGTLILV